MRIAVLILGLLLGLVMFIQAFLINILGQMGEDESIEGDGAVGLLVAIIWLVACALVISFPRVSAALFVLAAICAFAISGTYDDMAVWGVISLVLGVMSFLGFRGKRKQQRKDEERDRLIREGANAQIQLARQSATSARPRCAACGELNTPNARFCAGCGTALPTTAGAAS